MQDCNTGWIAEETANSRIIAVTGCLPEKLLSQKINGEAPDRGRFAIFIYMPGMAMLGAAVGFYAKIFEGSGSA